MKILFIGGGNMAHAMIGGLLAKGFGADALGVVEIGEEARQALRDKFGVTTYASPTSDAVAQADVIVLAVKPQQAQAVARLLAPLLKRALVLSIAAGIRVQDLSRWLGGYKKIVRSMPNTPALIQSGVTGLFAAPGADATARAHTEEIVTTLGAWFWVSDEALMDGVTAVSGSGPAYVFYLMEALQSGALEFGFTPESARLMALETVLGAARLAAASNDGFDVLRQRVTSKGGTTEAALHAMAEAGVAEGILAGVRAAAARGSVLGKQLGGQDGAPTDSATAGAVAAPGQERSS